MAIIKTYPLKSNYYGLDRLILSDMQPDAQGIVHGETKSLTLASLKSFIGSGSAPLTLTTTGTSGAATFDVNTNILNVPVYDSTTYTLQTLDKSSNSVPLKLDASSGTDSIVNFTEGANVTLTRTSDTEITISATGGNAGVSSITNAFGTYITGTNNTAATGAVGFGTINLSAVDGTSDSSTRFLSKDNTWDVPTLPITSSTGTENYLPKYSSDTSLANSAIYDNSSNIGIGTTSPAAKLDILDTVNQTSIRVTNNNYNNYLIQKRRTDDSQILGIQEFGSNGGLSLVTGGSQRLNVNNLGNVGIGTTTPSDGDLTIGTPKLHVAAAGTSGTFNLAARFESTTTDADNTGTSILINSFNDRGLLIKAGRKDGDREVAYFDVVNAVGTTTNMLTMGKFGTGYRIGIRTTTPTETLEVAGNIKTTSNFIGTASSGYSSMELGGPSGAFVDLKGPATDDYDLRIISTGTGGSILARNSSNVGVLAMDIDGDGNVGVGTTNPTTKLDVNGTVNLTNLTVSAAQGTNGQALTSTGSGVGWVTPPQGTITAVSGQSGISGAGTSGPVVLTNSDRGSTAVAALNFFKTIATPTNDVVASGNDDTVTLAAGGNTGIFINGSGSQVTIGLSAPTVLDRGGVKLVNATQQSTAANGLTTTAGRTYAVQLNSSGQAVVNVPWSGGSGGGISFSGTTSGGLATFSNSSTAAVSSQVTLNASGLMAFDAPDTSSAGSIDFDSNGTRLKIGDLSSGNSGIVEIFTNGNKQFQFGVNGEIGLGTGSAQGTSGQVLTSAGNGSPATWSSAGGNVPANNVTGSGNIYEIPMWNPQNGVSGSYIGAGNGFTSAPFKSDSNGRAIVNTNILGGITFQNGSSGQAAVKIDGSTGTGGAYEIRLPQTIAASTSKVLGVSSVSGSLMQTTWVDQTTAPTIDDGFIPLDIYQATLDIGGNEGNLSYIRQTQSYNNSTINKISFFVSSVGSSPEIRFALFDSAQIKNGSGTCRVNATSTSLTAGAINEMALTDGEGTNISYTCTPGKKLVLFFAIKNCTLAGSAALSNSGIGHQDSTYVAIPTVSDPLSTTITAMGTDPNNKIAACHFYKS